MHFRGLEPLVMPGKELEMSTDLALLFQRQEAFGECRSGPGEGAAVAIPSANKEHLLASAASLRRLRRSSRAWV